MVFLVFNAYFSLWNGSYKAIVGQQIQRNRTITTTKHQNQLQIDNHTTYKKGGSMQYTHAILPLLLTIKQSKNLKSISRYLRHLQNK